MMPRLQVQSRSWQAFAPRHSRPGSQPAGAICLVIRTKLLRLAYPTIVAAQIQMMDPLNTRIDLPQLHDRFFKLP